LEFRLRRYIMEVIENGDAIRDRIAEANGRGGGGGGGGMGGMD
jgi:hypothetical protein